MVFPQVIGKVLFDEVIYDHVVGDEDDVPIGQERASNAQNNQPEHKAMKAEP